MEKLSTLNSQLSTAKSVESEKKPYDLEARLLEYSIRIIRLVDSLPPTRSSNHVGGQLLRSGTSPLANHAEAQAAESVADFVHKLKISLKELEESRRWIRLIRGVPLIEKAEKLDPLIEETCELVRIFAKSVSTAEANMQAGTTRVREDEDDSSLWLPIPTKLLLSRVDVDPSPMNNECGEASRNAENCTPLAVES
jgi:four helix bundle protein